MLFSQMPCGSECWTGDQGLAWPTAYSDAVGASLMGAALHSWAGPLRSVLTLGFFQSVTLVLPSVILGARGSSI